MTLPVFFGNDVTAKLADVHPGDTLILGGDEGRHAAKVKRMMEGEKLDLVDGRGMRVRCQVAHTGSTTLTLTVRDIITEPAPATRLILIQALAKGGRDEQAIESATEIGVDAVIPWQANRSIVKWVAAKKEKAHAKWEALLQTAAKQSRRAWLPTVEDVCDSPALARWIDQQCARGALVYIAHEEAAHTLHEDLCSRAWSSFAPTGQEFAQAPGTIAVIVGPEGGISPEEHQAFIDSGAQEILLGPHVLRSSSAGACALTLISAALGRW